MSLFTRPRAAIWPKSHSANLYLDKSENNVFTCDINLWHVCTETELKSFDTILSDNKVDTVTVLIPDDVVYTKSFIYDSEITAIDKNEVIGLAESFINFKIYPECIDYQLIPSSGKTIIQAHIFERSKLNALETNLKALSIKSYSFESVSSSVAKLIGTRNDSEYFLVYPHDENEYILMLAKKDTVYLSTILKGKELEVQKTINYSKLYFPKVVTKFYLPSSPDISIIATTPLDKTPFSQADIAIDFKKPSNLPMAVVGLFVSKTIPPAIINSVDTNLKSKKMESKNKILPFIAVFVVTAAIASIIIWYVLNKNESTTETPVIETATPTPIIEEEPTATPTIPPVEVSKKLKLQVLNATEINGQAAVLKEKLTSLGFTSIAVGNSKEKLTENQIKMKASVSSASAYFATELAGFFDAAATTDLPATSTYDVVFYIGTKLNSSATGTTPATVDEEVAPTAKVTAKPTIKTTITVTPTTKVTGTVTPTAKVTVKPTATPAE